MNKFKLFFLVFLFSFNFSFSQTECSSKSKNTFLDGGQVTVEDYFKKGLHNFPSDIRTRMKNVTRYFGVDITFYLVAGFDGICHEFKEKNKGVISVGNLFLNAHKNDPLFFEVIIAHEIAHNIQHTYKNYFLTEFYNSYGEQILLKSEFEMQADVIAGYYLGKIMKTKYNKIKRNRDQESANNFLPMIEKTIEKFRSIADLDFTHDKHHGDFKDRTKAVALGFELGFEDRQVQNYWRTKLHGKINSIPKLYYYSFISVKEKLTEKGFSLDD